MEKITSPTSNFCNIYNKFYGLTSTHGLRLDAIAPDVVAIKD